MIGRRLGPLFILIIVHLSSNAFGLSVTTSVDREEVELGDPITLTISISGGGASAPDPTLPDLSDFDIYSSGRDQSVSIVNGRFSSSLEITYVLVPKKIGSLMIGPVVIRDKNNMAVSDPIKIQVKQPGIIESPPRQKSETPKKQPSRISDDFFLEQSVNKKNPYVGEQVTLTLKFYQAENLWEQPTLEWPKYVGFTVEDLPPNSRSYKFINGRRYLVTEIKRALFPISAGSAVIGSPKLTIKSDDFGGFMDPFDFFDFGSRGRARRRQPKILTADPIDINVRRLPQGGRPDDFAGAVGQYKIRVDVDKDSVGVDEPITMKVRLSGTGNIKSLPPVQFPEFSDFRVYESGKTESINNKGGVVSGSKTFELALIPKTSGSFTIPPLEYAFFDPKKGAYRTIKTNPIAIFATGEGLADVGGAPKNIIGAGKKTFGYIITEFPEPDNRIDLSSSFVFWFLQGIPLIGIIAAIVYRSHYRKLLADRGYARRLTAVKRAKSIFKSAMAKKASGDYSGFYGEIFDAVVGFIADRLNLEKSGLTIDDIGMISKIDRVVRDELVGFLEECQITRFAPSVVDAKQADEILKKASSLLGRLEKLL